MARPADPDAAFAAFVREHGARLQHTARLLTGHHQSGEDLVQTVLTKMYLRWSRIDAPLAYAHKALVSTHVDGWRRHWRGETPTEVMPEHSVDPTASSPGDAYGAVDSRDELRRALATLSRRDRAIIVLRFYADQSGAQTAATLGLPVGTVKSATSRALATLRVATNTPSAQAP